MRSFMEMWYDPVARKKILIFGGAGLAFIIILIIIIVVATSGSKPTHFVGSQVLQNVPLIDGHNNVANNILALENNQLKDFDFTNATKKSNWVTANNTHTDLDNLIQGKVRGQFFAAYADCDELNPIGRTLDQIDVIKRLIAKYPNQMDLVTGREGIMNAFYHDKVGSLIGIDGGHSIDSSLAVLRLYYELGARYMTLVNECNTPWAEFHGTPNETIQDGLNEFGKAVVLEMNRLGMIVDLAHASEKTMITAIDTSKAPVIFSHSSARSLTENGRNVPDAVLRKLADKEGLIMVNFGADFVRPNTTTVNVTMDDVIAHLDHIKNVTGSSKFVGIGADYDGFTLPPTDLANVSRYPELFDRLAEDHGIHVGWAEADLRNLAGDNFLRVLAKVEEIRDDPNNQIPVHENHLNPTATA